MNQIADHLWQSTLFAGVVWLLTLALRKNRARVRHGVWLAASLKFLVPFSLFIALGSLVPRRAVPVAVQSKVYVVMDQVSQPFTAPAVAVTASAAPNPLPALLLSLWACGFIGITFAWCVRWRRIQVAVRAGTPVNLDIRIKAMSSPTLLEPGVFGIFQPVLLLPQGITERLTPAQLQAVIAHELCHVRYRDNLIATIHMFVETVFWFHPLVWWIGKRMVEERERACDEEVLRELGEPRTYAEGILNVCKLYVELPLECISGVTGGSNLKNRIEAIMTNRVALRLNFAKKVALAVTVTAALAMPIVVGMMHAQSPAAPKFEVAAIKPSLEGTGVFSFDVTPSGRMTTRNFSVWKLIQIAYGLHDLQMSGGPAWIKSKGFDIQAQPMQSDTPVPRDQVNRMLQALLEDRFQLKWHHESREAPAYGLSITARGPKLAPSHEGQGRTMFGDLNAPSMSIDELCQILEYELDRPVVNQTNLSGPYTIQLQWDSERAPAANRADNELRPSLFTAVQEQLGLKLEPIKAKAEVFVIDSVETPSEN